MFSIPSCSSVFLNCNFDCWILHAVMESSMHNKEIPGFHDTPIFFVGGGGDTAIFDTNYHKMPHKIVGNKLIMPCLFPLPPSACTCISIPILPLLSKTKPASQQCKVHLHWMNLLCYSGWANECQTTLDIARFLYSGIGSLLPNTNSGFMHTTGWLLFMDLRCMTTTWIIT